MAYSFVALYKMMRRGSDVEGGKYTHLILYQVYPSGS